MNDARVLREAVQALLDAGERAAQRLMAFAGGIETGLTAKLVQDLRDAMKADAILRLTPSAPAPASPSLEGLFQSFVPPFSASRIDDDAGDEVAAVFDGKNDHVLAINDCSLLATDDPVALATSIAEAMNRAALSTPVAETAPGDGR